MTGDKNREDPTSPNYRQAVWTRDLPEEFFESLRADMDKRAARADPERALRILDETSPAVPPDPDDELE